MYPINFRPFLLLLLAGCTPELAEPMPFSNPRNTLLARIQGQSEEESIRTVCDIACSDPEREMRRTAIQYLGSLGTAATDVSSSLVNALTQEKDAYILNDLQLALAQIGPSAVPHILRCAESSQGETLFRLMRTLGDLGPAAATAVPWLRQQLEAADFATRKTTVNALGRIGPSAKPALAQLTIIASAPRIRLQGAPQQALLYRQSRDLQAEAIQAISRIGADLTALSALRMALGEEASIAEAAAIAIAQLGTEGAAAIPELQLLSQRNDFGGKDIKTAMARRAAQQALSSISGKP